MCKAEQQLAGILFPIGAITIGSQNRQVAGQIGDRFGHKVIVFASVQWDTNTVLLAQFTRPHAAAVYDDISGDYPLRGAYACDPSAVDQHLFDLHVFMDLRAVHPRPFGQCLRQVNRIGRAIAGHVNAALHALWVHQGPAFGDFCGGHRMCLNPEKSCKVRLAFQFRVAFIVHSDRD